jgi:hypothetical protein
MATPWETFYPYLQPHVPGCPEIVIVQHLQEAAVDFCERSGVWRYDLESDFTSKSLSDYEVFLPNNTTLENILVLYLNDSPLTKVVDSYHFTSSGAGNGRPSYYSIYQDSFVRFYPTPDAKYTFGGVATIKPSLDATGVEDFIYNTHGRAIACGALGKLLNIPGKEWTNPELAAYYRMKFDKAADDALGRDIARGSLRVASRGFDKPTRRRGA